MSSSSDEANARAFEAIRAVLAELLKRDNLRVEEIRRETSLVEDLGMDSFLFVDLTLTLEEKLGIAKFPMRRWADAEVAQGGRFTIGSLAACCAELTP